MFSPTTSNAHPSLRNYALINLSAAERIQGVGFTRTDGGRRATFLRVWLDPWKVAPAADDRPGRVEALRKQNVQVAARSDRITSFVGPPNVPVQTHVNVQGRLRNRIEFGASC